MFQSSEAIFRTSEEATATDKRNYAQQFERAKTEEYQSWVDHDVFDLVDIRRLSKYERRNLVSGRWVLTIKRDKDGKFLKCKARWVLRGFQDKQKITSRRTVQQPQGQASEWLVRRLLTTTGT